MTKKEFSIYTYKPTGYRYDNDGVIKSIHFEYTYCPKNSKLAERWREMFKRCKGDKCSIEMRCNGTKGTILMA